MIDFASSGGEIAGVACKLPTFCYDELTTAFLLPWMKPGGPVDELEKEEWNEVDVREGELR